MAGIPNSPPYPYQKRAGSHLLVFLFSLLFLNYINRHLRINLTRIIEADSVIYTVRLGLCLEAKCTVLDRFNATVEEVHRCYLSQEISRVELYAGLVGIHRHF